MRKAAGAAIALAGIISLFVAPSAFGASSSPIAFGAYTSGAPEEPSLMDDLAAKVDRSPAIVVWYRYWSEQAFVASQMRAVADRGAVPLVTWEPWRPDRTGYGLRAIARGDYDSYIRASARDAAAWPGPLLVRFAHEMNGKWYPWGAGVGGNTADDYVDAWRHVVALFRSEGADNVRWVWAPNTDDGGKLPFARFYPGDGWVDWVGLDGYNWGAKYDEWQSFTDVFKSSYDALGDITGKPVMITETAANEKGGDKAEWIANALECELPGKFRRVRAIVWFDKNYDGVDWRVDSSAASLAAFRTAISSPLYGLDGASLLSGASGSPVAAPDCLSSTAGLQPPATQSPGTQPTGSDTPDQTSFGTAPALGCAAGAQAGSLCVGSPSARTLRVARNWTVGVPITCGRTVGSGCGASVTLTEARRKGRRLGTARLNLAPGQTGTVRVRVVSRARGPLRRRGKIGARVTVTDGGAARSWRVRLVRRSR